MALKAKNVGLALIIVAVLNCSSADKVGGFIGQVIASVTVSPTSTNTTVGNSVSLSAVVKDVDGNVVPQPSLTWTSSAPEVATVDANGRVTGVAPGTAQVKAEASGISATATVAVATVNNWAANFSQSCNYLACTFSDQSGTGSAAWSWNFGDNTTANTAAPAHTYAAQGTYTVTLTVTNSGGATSSVSHTIAVTAQTTGGGPEIGFADFENGTLGGFLTGDRTSNTGNSNITIVDDPTGKRGGKVVRLNFFGPGGWDRSIQTNATPSIGMGQTFYMAGWVYFPTPDPSTQTTFMQRKIFYPQMLPNENHAMLTSWAVKDAAGVWYIRPQFIFRTAAGGTGTLNFGRIDFNTWTYLEFQVTLNSGVDAPDGVMRLWINGVLAGEITNAVNYWDASTSSYTMQRYFIGNQAEDNQNNPTFQEYRYWDNVTVSRSRIGMK